jgi:hypothetical protein
MPYSDNQWIRFFELVGREDIVADPRFTTLAGRQQNVAMVWSELGTELARRTTADWVELLERDDIPFAAVNSLEDLLDDPHLEKIGFWQLIEDPDGGRLRIRVHRPLGRTATRDTEVAGHPIAKGEFLMLALAAACRDPRYFENSHDINIRRKIAVNPAFSFGPHRCIGSHVARQQGMITLEEVLRRLPGLALAEGGEPQYSNSTIARNMDSLTLTFTPGSREGALDTGAGRHREIPCR